MASGAPTVGVIGMGRVGPGIASALRANGHRIVGVSARSEQSQERAEMMLPGVRIVPAVTLAKASDILFLAVPDEQIEPLCQELVDEGGIHVGQVVLHLSGAKGIEALQSAAKIGALPIAIHPAMTFTGTSLDVKALEGLPFAYTCSPVAAPLAASLVGSIGGDAFFVAEEDRPLYHAALAHASNHLLTVISQAARALTQAGVEDPQAAMSPLVRSAAERALAEGIGGLTGPLQRGDLSTVESHLAALQSVPDLAGVKETYAHLAEATLNELLRHGQGLAEEDGQSETSVEPILFRTKADLLEALGSARAAHPIRVGLVMTMGALHEGHLSLVERLKKDHDRVLVTIFVNPAQFGEGEDFEKYPRNLEDDLAKLKEVGADWVYAPTVDQVYRIEPRVTLMPGYAATVLEGALRPGHFAGVLQIVGKVLTLVRPTTAIFGQKDAQQFVNIRQMVEDLDHQVSLIEAPIVRDSDGLALSSRNAYLSEEERRLALKLSQSLRVGEEAAVSGVSAQEVVERAAEVFSDLADPSQVKLEYVALADQESFELLALWAPTESEYDLLGGTEISSKDVISDLGSGSNPGAYLSETYLLVAARVGGTRLIDNVKVQVRNQ